MKQTLALMLVAILGLAVAARAQEAQESSTTVTGEILKLDRDNKVIEITHDDDSVGYVVDESSVPGWYTLNSVGDTVTLTCQSFPERGELVVAIQKVRSKDDPK